MEEMQCWLCLLNQDAHFKKIPPSNYTKVFIEIHLVSQSVSIFLNVNSCKLIKSYIFNKWVQDPLTLLFGKIFKQVRNCFQVFKECRYEGFFKKRYYVYYLREKNHKMMETFSNIRAHQTLTKQLFITCLKILLLPGKDMFLKN